MSDARFSLQSFWHTALRLKDCILGAIESVDMLDTASVKRKFHVATNEILTGVSERTPGRRDGTRTEPEVLTWCMSLGTVPDSDSSQNRQRAVSQAGKEAAGGSSKKPQSK